MEPALLYCSEDQQISNNGVTSIFTQKSLVLKEKSLNFDYNFEEEITPIKSYKSRNSRKRNYRGTENAKKIKEFSAKKNHPYDEVENELQWKFQSSVYNASKVTHIRESLIGNETTNFSQPNVVDSFAARRDIIPHSELSISNYCCDNLLITQSYRGKPSKFLDKQRLTQFSEMLLEPSFPTRLLKVDGITTKNLEHFSSFICPCGFVCGLADKDEHQTNCSIKANANFSRINEYRSLSPKRCPDIDLPVTCYRDAKSTNGADATLWGIETGYKFGKIVECDFKSTFSGYYLLKVYKCQTCDFWCSELQLFANHLAIHEPQKPFGCSACNYRSVWCSSIVRHLKLGKLRNIQHLNAIVLSGFALQHRVCAPYRAFIKLQKNGRKIVNFSDIF